MLPNDVLSLLLLLLHITIILLSRILISKYANIVLERDMGKWRCLWCSKIIEGESFMELVKSIIKEHEPIHAWENISFLEKTPLEHELLA
jgi:hypothetical protein